MANHLPPEIKAAIARELVTISTEPRFVLRGLCDVFRLSVVSRSWHFSVEPILYELAVVYDWLSSLSPDVHSTPDAVLITAASTGDLLLIQHLVAHLPKAQAIHNFTSQTYLTTTFPVSKLHGPDALDISTGTATSTVGRSRANALHAAVVAGQSHVVDWILEHEVDVDCFAQIDRRSMPHLISYYLIPRLGDPDMSTTATMTATPLQLAIAHRHTSVAKTLILAGAVWDRPFCFSRGLTALHMMAAGGMVDLVEWLCRMVRDAPDSVVACNGPLHDWPDNSGRSSLHYAAHAPPLLDKCDFEEGRGRGIAACRLVEALYSLGALWNTKDQREIERRVLREKERIGWSRIMLWHELDKASARSWAFRMYNEYVMVRNVWRSRATAVDYALARQNITVAFAIIGIINRERR